MTQTSVLSLLRHGFVLGMALNSLGCGLESRLEGTWVIDEGVEVRDLARQGIDPQLAPSLLESPLVAEDGVIYLGAEHPDTAVATYRLVSEKGDCARVRVEVAREPSGKRDSTEVDACLRDPELEVRLLVGQPPLTVTLRRGD